MMKPLCNYWRLALPVIFVLALAEIAQAEGDVSSPAKPPAQYTSNGEFAGGDPAVTSVLTGVRFGKIDGATRMVLDLGDAKTHPDYHFELKAFPFRLVARFTGVTLASAPKVQQNGALPFSVVTSPDGLVKELQIFLAGPSEFKVIEVDEPAKLAIDVRSISAVVPDIYTVQLTAPQSAAEAFALVEQGKFPEGFNPEVLVIGQFIVVEQAFTEPAAAAAMDSALRASGYASVINERNGAELPQR